MIKKIFYILPLLTMFGCNFYEPTFMESDVPDGPPEFQAGWRDGCQTGIATKKHANSSVYRPTFGSGIYQHDKLYQQAWGNAYYVCYVMGSKSVSSNIFTTSPAD